MSCCGNWFMVNGTFDWLMVMVCGSNWFMVNCTFDCLMMMVTRCCSNWVMFRNNRFNPMVSCSCDGFNVMVTTSNN